VPIRPRAWYQEAILVDEFTELNLNPALLKALESEGYSTPTPIQSQAIPHVMAGRDLLGIAQTGTGKTAAFALPIMHRLAADRKAPLRKGCRTLILSPTRELASQIAESFRTYGRHMGMKVAVVFGGVAHRPQIQAMAPGVDVLVATPGRLIDHMMERNVQLEGTEIFVLDEADQMLDLGFVADPPHRAEAGGTPAEPVLLGHHAEGDRPPCRRAADHPEGPSPRRDHLSARRA
jgi:ATP-dependent RNA helicase RhlE